MPDNKEPQQPAREKQSFQLIKTTRLDKKGRFYVPGSLVENIFAGVPDAEREVDVYLGPGGRIMLVPARD